MDRIESSPFSTIVRGSPLLRSWRWIATSRAHDLPPGMPRSASTESSESGRISCSVAPTGCGLWRKQTSFASDEEQVCVPGEDTIFFF